MKGIKDYIKEKLGDVKRWKEGEAETVGVLGGMNVGIIKDLFEDSNARGKYGRKAIPFIKKVIPRLAKNVGRGAAGGLAIGILLRELAKKYGND